MSALHSEVSRWNEPAATRKALLIQYLRLRGGRRFFGPAAASRPYSRRVAPLKFGASLPSRRMSRLGSSTQLGERVLMTRSPFFGQFNHTVLKTFGSVGALADRLFNISPSKYTRAASPMLSNVSGVTS